MSYKGVSEQARSLARQWAYIRCDDYLTSLVRRETGVTLSPADIARAKRERDNSMQERRTFKDRVGQEHNSDGQQAAADLVAARTASAEMAARLASYRGAGA